MGPFMGSHEIDDQVEEPRWSDLWPTENEISILPGSDYENLRLVHPETDFDPTRTSPGPIDHTIQPYVTRSESGQIFSQVQEDPSTTSLENLSNAFSFYIGPTGPSDVSLLSQHAHLGRLAPGLSFRKVSDDRKAKSTIFGITEYELIDTVEPSPGKNEIETAWRELWSIVDRRTALQLYRLYFRFINPYFPVLDLVESTDVLDGLSLALIAGICASSVPFMLYDEELYDVLPRPPSRPQLYRLCWLGITQELHAPTLATVQACLMLQHHLPANPVLSDTAFKWSLNSITVSVAQTVGLHRDPSQWTLVPLQERLLRQRLWWAVWTMDQWLALSRGMPALINDEDADVPHLPVRTGCELSGADLTINHFERLTHLTLILNDIRTTYYTVRGESRTAEDLSISLDAARTLRTRLRTWQETLPDNLRSWSRSSGRVTGGDREADHHRRLDGNASLHLSYIVVHMLLFRALFRPIKHLRSSGRPPGMSDDRVMREGVSAITTGSIFCARELVDFLENLDSLVWNAFWHCWSRPNFAMAGLFMVDLLLVLSQLGNSDSCQITESSDSNIHADAASEDGLKELKRLIERWRWINRVSANGAAGVKGLTTLGLFKVETILAELRRSQTV
ncbi:Transcriptional activator protein DAL81 [Cyphellophora attinorum]|uniref:Transcriptional activator protein DAL81 n=1 Tax=Cyphellophora attinorum TaxID=1664694 RepID=A0A0N1HE71_9EURO|nr:Transcriptional activator protein DAL81 [Phialophora attinorum]KPI43620.1 Transcriptional activator protein DAL81 [Phialophora attinorum]